MSFGCPIAAVAQQSALPPTARITARNGYGGRRKAQCSNGLPRVGGVSKSELGTRVLRSPNLRTGVVTPLRGSDHRDYSTLINNLKRVGGWTGVAHTVAETFEIIRK
jgi:hypothetical protein